MIRKETIQNIIDATRVEEVVGDFVSLKKRGVNYIGLCPFHNEKTPSFTVSPAKGFYHCFGCGKGGGSVDFIMEHEHISYPDALRYLAEKYHIEIVEEIQTAEEKQMQSEIETLYNVVSYAQKHFSDNLFNTEPGIAIGLTYFTERGFNKEIIKKFQLGYSPEKWDDLSKKAIDDGYSIDYLYKTGLAIKKDEGGFYDRFRDRVIFPIHNLSGRIVGFTSRILSSDKNKPKYVNSPESEIYSKGKTLYGIYFAKSAIVAANNCYLVEGNTDVISLYQSGVENVVASSGTALTTDQIKLIKKFTQNITILYDGDEAGIKASLRGIDMVLEEGLNVKIVLFPQGEDPDSYARKHDAIQIKKFITENAVNFILFKTKLLLDEAQHDPIKKAELIKEIVRTISLMPEPIHRSLYIKECGELMQIQEQSLLNELNKLLRKKYKKDVASPAELESFDAPEYQEPVAEKQFVQNPYDSIPLEQHLLWLVLIFGETELLLERPIEEKPSHTETFSIKVSEYILMILNNEDIKFSDAKLQQIFDEYYVQLQQPESNESTYFINHPDKEISKLYREIINQINYLSKNWEEKYHISTPVHEDKDKAILVKDISNTINAIQLNRVSKDLNEIEDEMKILQKENSGDPELMILLDKFLKKHAIKAQISVKLGRVIN
ncbi:MAG: DNA primase [Bacteroidota bacterium]